MTTQHIYMIPKGREGAVFWSDGVGVRSPWTTRRDELIRYKSFRESPYYPFSDFKRTCVLMIPKEFC